MSTGFAMGEVVGGAAVVPYSAVRRERAVRVGERVVADASVGVAVGGGRYCSSVGSLATTTKSLMSSQTRELRSYASPQVHCGAKVAGVGPLPHPTLVVMAALQPISPSTALHTLVYDCGRGHAMVVLWG